MIVSALLQPCYNLLHATLLHSGWWPLSSEILNTHKVHTHKPILAFPTQIKHVQSMLHVYDSICTTEPKSRRT